MPLFTTKREKRFWLYAFAVLLAIMSSLVLDRSFVVRQIDQGIAAILFWIAFILIGTTVLVHGLWKRPNKTELAIWLGIAAVYLLLFLRLGLPERSHLMEYSVLAVFIHKALMERGRLQSRALRTGILAFMVTFLLGVLDELVQFFLPNRVFDPIDILFNGLASFLAVSASMVLQWAKKKFSKKKQY